MGAPQGEGSDYGVAPGLTQFGNSTWRIGGRPGRSSGKTSGNSLTTDMRLSWVLLRSPRMIKVSPLMGMWTTFSSQKNSSMILDYHLYHDNVETIECNLLNDQFRKHDKLLTLAVGCFQWLALCFYSSWGRLLVIIVAVVIVVVTVVLVVVVVEVPRTVATGQYDSLVLQSCGNTIQQLSFLMAAWDMAVLADDGVPL
ncbi:hypothetical protein Tco_1272525 [Tanacetum coccineum]